MVTVHHQQSGINRDIRIVAESSLKSSCYLHGSFQTQDQFFHIYDSPTQELIEAARTAINEGHSAGIIKKQCIQPSAMFFDMDGTVIAEESLVEIARSAGKFKQIQELTERAMAGEMDFCESLKLRLVALKGLRRDQVESISPNLNPGMQDMAMWCHARQIPLFLVSGGFVDLAGPIAKSLQFMDFRANRFAWNDDIMLGETDGPIVDALGKKQAMIEWCKTHTIAVSKTIGIGDGANDLEFLKSCGLAVGFAPKPILWPHLDISNHTGDHRFLIQCLLPNY
jgi:phosphoserine phosphatase